MVALFVVLMIAVFLVIDVILHIKRQPALAEQIRERQEETLLAATRVAGFRFDPEASYHAGHTWARRAGEGLARIGLDDFAAKLVGRPDRIDLPAVGTTVRAGRPLLTLERKGRRITILAPVGGVVAAVNRDLAERPEALTAAPYQSGWLAEIKSAELSYDLRSLLTGEMARRFLDEAAAALHAFFAPAEMAPAAADGGEPLEGIGDQLDDAAWERAQSRFLLTDAR